MQAPHANLLRMTSRRDFLGIATAAPDVAAALIVGARSEEQVLANVTSMQARIPPEFWTELKRQKLIEQNAPTPG